MGKASTNVVWKGNMSFEAEVNGHKFMIDADETNDGENQGPRPKPLMLTALAGCTGMDVVSILKKMRVELKDFKVTVDGELTDGYPKYFNKMLVTYEFWGKDLPKEKIQKAIDLSEESYCGVSIVYKKAMPIESKIIIHES